MTCPQNSFDSTTQQRIDAWLQNNYDQTTKEELKKLIQTNPQEVTAAFYTQLAFGTGGLRGIMGIGTNRMNTYTVRGATQGLANYIKRAVGLETKPSVIIGFDSRRRSEEFALESAKVLAASGIKAYVFKHLRPTPLVSFGCRYKQCTAAIMVTASHNPPQYNGYKVYWNDGAQVLPPHDVQIIKEVNQITDLSAISTVELPHSLIEIIDQEIDLAYLETISKLQNCPDFNKHNGKQLKIVYSALHGTGITLMPQALKTWGFSSMTGVDEQNTPDGSFPTVKYPNPEEPAALKLGIEKLQQTNSDILIATDPDTDRMGVAVAHKGKIELLNGNQIACLCLEHICKTLADRLPAKAAFVKTVVTTELFAAIAESYQRPCFNVLTGFKYIGELIRKWETEANGYQYIFGGEESYGYLLGTHARDKDAIISACLLSEAALQAKMQGKTLIDMMHSIYQKYGIFREHLLNLSFAETKEGKETMTRLMQTLRQSPPKTIADVEVVAVEDFQACTRKDIKQNRVEPLQQPRTDLLIFWLADKSKLAIRPSGTEPKVKVYCGVEHPFRSQVIEEIASADLHAQKLMQALQQLAKSS